MGLFDEVGINPDELKVATLPDGPHPGMLSDVTRKESKDGRLNVIFEFTIDGWEFPVTDWHEVATKPATMWDDTDDSYNVFTVGARTVRQTEKVYFTGKYKALKKRLMDLGVPEDRLNSVDPADLKGVRVVVTTKNNKKGFPQVEAVTIPGSSGVTLPSGPPVMATVGAAVPNVAAAPLVPAPAPAQAFAPAGPNPFAKQ